MIEEPSNTAHDESGSDAGQGLWQACVEQLAQELPELQFNTWIKPLAAQVEPDLSKVTLLVANRFKLDWIRAQYAGRISAILEGLYGQPIPLELALAQREAPAKPYTMPSSMDANAPIEPAGLGDDVPVPSHAAQQ